MPLRSQYPFMVHILLEFSYKYCFNGNKIVLIILKLSNKNVPFAFQMGRFWNKMECFKYFTELYTKSWYKKLLKIFYLKLLPYRALKSPTLERPFPALHCITTLILSGAVIWSNGNSWTFLMVERSTQCPQIYATLN